MSAPWLLLVLLLPGVSPFMIHNTHATLCLEEESTGQVQLRICNLDQETQQWEWISGGRLMNVASLGCLTAEHVGPVRTTPCDGSEGDISDLEWDCDSNRLVARKASLFLSVEGQRLTLASASAHVKWRSVDVGDICQDQLRSKRSSVPDDEPGEDRVMLTEEQKQYLRWFYRTEDPTMWKFVLLGSAFVCLLIGLLLLGMGIMGSKNRRKIAKFKAAVALAQKSNMEELQVISTARDDTLTSTPKLEEAAKHPPVNGDTMDVSAGNIIVTWKDGNTSNLYSDVGVEKQLEGEERASVGEEEEEEEEKEVRQDEMC